MLAWSLLIVLFGGISAANKTSGHEKRSLMSSFVPGFQNWNEVLNGSPNIAAGIPILHSITQAIPSLRALPEVSGGTPVASNRDLNNAIDQFTAPIVRFATGGQPVASDVQQFIQSIPNFIVSSPGFKDIDPSTLDPRIVEHVLKGGQLPGLTKDTMSNIIQSYMKQVYEAANASLSGTLAKGQEKFLIPMEKLPKEMINNVMGGQALPGLTKDETQTITDFYAKSITKVPASRPDEKKKKAPGSSVPLAELWKLLPTNYDISKIPQEIFEAVMNGEFPDMKGLPKDLLSHFMQNSDKIASLLTKLAPPNSTLNEILSKIPKFDKPAMTTFSPYDINKLTTDMKAEEELAARAAKMRIYTAIGLGIIGAITLFAVGIFIVILKRKHARKTQPKTQLTPGPPLANSTMIRD